MLECPVKTPSFFFYHVKATSQEFPCTFGYSMIAPHIIEHLQRGSGWPLKTLSFNKQGHKFQKLTEVR